MPADHPQLPPPPPRPPPPPVAPPHLLPPNATAPATSSRGDNSFEFLRAKLWWLFPADMSDHGDDDATDAAGGGACVDDASYADPDGDGCAAYADASTASAYCDAGGGYEASCASCCACATQPSCADALTGGGGSDGGGDDDSDGRVDYGEVLKYLMGVEQRSSCESDVEHGGQGGIHQPVNVVTSLARVVVGTALLAPRRFRACGLKHEHGGEQLGGALLAAAGVLCCAHYLFGLRLLRATEVALCGTYVCWFVGEWLRCVMRQPLLLRILAVAAIPGAQVGLVRFVYAELPVDFGALGVLCNFGLRD